MGGGDAVSPGGDSQESAAASIEQWLLLRTAIRTLVVLLVVSAMAKPFLETFGAIIAGTRGLTR